FGAKSQDALVQLAKQQNVREFALRALADDIRESATVPTQPFVAALADPNPRVRLQAVTGLGRLGKTETTSAILPLVADPDPLTSHATMHALMTLHTDEICLQTLNSPRTADFVPGAMRVLQSLHEPT